MSADREFHQGMQEGLARLDSALNPHLRGWTPAQRMLRQQLLAYRRSYHDYFSWCKVTPWFDAEGRWHWDRSPAQDVWSGHSPADRRDALDALKDLEQLCRAHGEPSPLAATLIMRARLLAAFEGSGAAERTLALAEEALRLARVTGALELVRDIERFLHEERAAR